MPPPQLGACFGWSARKRPATAVARTVPLGLVTQIIAAGAFLALDVESAFGLGSADSARLFWLDGSLVDSYIRSAHSTTPYGRCLDVTGDLVTTTRLDEGRGQRVPGSGTGVARGRAQQRCLLWTARTSSGPT